MQPRPPHRLADALFRLLAARPGARAAGIFALGPSGCRIVAGTAELDALRLPPLGPWLAPQLPLRDTVRIDPGSIRLAGAFAAIAPSSRPARPTPRASSWSPTGARAG